MRNKNVLRKIADVLKIKSTRAMIFRLVIFLGIYTVINFFHGTLTESLYEYKMSTQDSFYYYFLYPILFLFAYLKKEDLKQLKHYKNKIPQTLILGLIAVGILFMPIKPILTLFKETPSIAGLIYYGQINLSLVFLFISIFNFNFVKKFKLELSLILIFILGYMGSQYAIQTYWQHFSTVIVFLLTLTLPLFNNDILFRPEHFEMTLNGFKVYVGPPCSGIYSMVTFALLFIYSAMFLKQNNEIHIFRAIAAFVVGIILVFLLNVIRISIILLIGGYYSPELAIDLFHEYLSAIFLIGLFLIYLVMVLPRLAKSSNLK